MARPTLADRLDLAPPPAQTRPRLDTTRRRDHHMTGDLEAFLNHSAPYWPPGWPSTMSPGEKLRDPGDSAPVASSLTPPAETGVVTWEITYQVTPRRVDVTTTVEHVTAPRNPTGGTK